MATSHVASLQLMHYDNVTGAIIDKSNPATTLLALAKSSTDFRVVVDPAIPNTAGNPTIKAYLIAEALAGFLLKHIDQTFIITEGP